MISGCSRGVHLKDLVLLNVALPDRLGDSGDVINVRKMAQLSLIFSELMRLQTASLQIQPNMDMASMIRVSHVKLTSSSRQDHVKFTSTLQNNCDNVTSH